MGDPVYLFFDTETTGLPLRHDAPPTALRNWPRLVQLSWQLTDEHGVVISSGDHIIRPEGFSIPPEASDGHGITDAMAREKGVSVHDDTLFGTCFYGTHNSACDIDATRKCFFALRELGVA